MARPDTHVRNEAEVERSPFSQSEDVGNITTTSSGPVADDNTIRDAIARGSAGGDTEMEQTSASQDKNVGDTTISPVLARDRDSPSDAAGRSSMDGVSVADEIDVDDLMEDHHTDIEEGSLQSHSLGPEDSELATHANSTSRASVGGDTVVDHAMTGEDGSTHATDNPAGDDAVVDNSMTLPATHPNGGDMMADDAVVVPVSQLEHVESLSASSDELGDPATQATVIIPETPNKRARSAEPSDDDADANAHLSAKRVRHTHPYVLISQDRNHQPLSVNRSARVWSALMSVKIPTDAWNGPVRDFLIPIRDLAREVLQQPPTERQAGLLKLKQLFYDDSEHNLLLPSTAASASQRTGHATVTLAALMHYATKIRHRMALDTLRLGLVAIFCYHVARTKPSRSASTRKDPPRLNKTNLRALYENCYREPWTHTSSSGQQDVQHGVCDMDFEAFCGQFRLYQTVGFRLVELGEKIGMGAMLLYLPYLPTFEVIRQTVTPRGEDWPRAADALREKGLGTLAHNEGVDSVYEALVQGFDKISWEGTSMEGGPVLGKETSR